MCNFIPSEKTNVGVDSSDCQTLMVLSVPCHGVRCPSLNNFIEEAQAWQRLRIHKGDQSVTTSWMIQCLVCIHILEYLWVSWKHGHPWSVTSNVKPWPRRPLAGSGLVSGCQPDQVQWLRLMTKPLSSAPSVWGKCCTINNVSLTGGNMAGQQTQAASLSLRRCIGVIRKGECLEIIRKSWFLLNVVKIKQC